MGLGNAYRLSEKTEEAIAVYERVQTLFPRTTEAKRAKSFVKSLSAD